MTMTFLASKVEESPRKLRDVILKGLAIRFRTVDAFNESSPEYLKLYGRVLQLEKTALAVLCFDLTIDHPFRHLARLFNSYPDSKSGCIINAHLFLISSLEFDKEFTKEIWTSLTDSFCTPLPILFPPRVLAIGILLHEMSKRPETFSSELYLPEFLGEKGDEWEKHLGKVPREEVDKVLSFLSRTDLPFKH